MYKNIPREKGFTLTPERASSKQKHKAFNARLASGFTLIEIIAVLGVLAVTSAILLVNNSISQQQLSLSKDASGVANAVSRAKSLTLQNLDENTCGYGVHFVSVAANQDSYIIFKDKKISGSCNYVYDEGEAVVGQESTSNLDTGLRFVSSNSNFLIQDVIFYSSDATVKMTNFSGSGISPAGIVIIQTELIPRSYTTLKVTTSGQISSKTGFYSTPDNFDSGTEDLPNGETTVQQGTEQVTESNIKEENPFTCIPLSCAGKTCADYNGCGVSCVVCPVSTPYCVNKACMATPCTPSCSGKVCGNDDGCGGVCTSCPTGETCSAQSGTYQCVSSGVNFRLKSISPSAGTK
jgi:prepilin-type N-terminal cleavage/methylation domain-containing protein